MPTAPINPATAVPWQSFINRSYNVVRQVLKYNHGQTRGADVPWINIAGSQNDLAIYADTAFQSFDSEDGPTRTAWTWMDMIGNIWFKFPKDARGTFPTGFRDIQQPSDGSPPPAEDSTLPFGYPLNRKYLAISAWDAFVECVQDYQILDYS